MQIGTTRASVSAHELWAALRIHGGMHLVRTALRCSVGCMCHNHQSALLLCLVAPHQGVLAVGPLAAPHPTHTPTPPACLQVRKRGVLLQVVQGLEGQALFPAGLVRTLDARLLTWFQSIYGFSEEEELGKLPSLQGGCGCFQGVLLAGALVAGGQLHTECNKATHLAC